MGSIAPIASGGPSRPGIIPLIFCAKLPFFVTWKDSYYTCITVKV